MQWVDLAGETVENTPINSRATMYADGFFTTLRVFDSKCQLLHYHILRLERSAHTLGLALDLPALRARLTALADDLKMGIIKVHASRALDAAYPRGYAGLQTECDVHIGLVRSAPVAHLPNETIKIQTMNNVAHGCEHNPKIQPSMEQSLQSADAPFLIQAAGCAVLLEGKLGLKPAKLAGLKTLDRLEQVLAATELEQVKNTHRASEVNIVEGLVCTLDDHICEGVASNVFFYADNAWCTPKLEQAGVAGTLRAAILEHTDVREVETSLAVFLDTVQAAFFCNALRGIQPIVGFMAVTELQDVHDLTKVRLQHRTLDLTLVEKFHAQLCDNVDFMRVLCASGD